MFDSQFNELWTSFHSCSQIQKAPKHAQNDQICHKKNMQEHFLQVKSRWCICKREERFSYRTRSGRKSQQTWIAARLLVSLYFLQQFYADVLNYWYYKTGQIFVEIVLMLWIVNYFCKLFLLWIVISFNSDKVVTRPKTLPR